MPYSLRCGCGQQLQGVRTVGEQVIHCPACRETHFILPRSPLPPVEPQDGTPPPPGTPWLLPLIAATLTLIVVAGGLVVLLSHLGTPTPEVDGKGQPPGNSLEEVVASGRKLLGEGSFQTALQVLQPLRERGERGPDFLQLHREAQLLARLSPLPLEEIIAKGQKDKRELDWQARFQDYKGRAILFDDVIARAADGRHRLVNYQVQVAEQRAEVRLDLTLLRQLPLHPPHRVLFGARLANVTFGTWLVEFEPDSGVLLTDEGAARALGLGPLDAELRQLLHEQAAWARQLKD